MTGVGYLTNHVKDLQMAIRLPCAHPNPLFQEESLRLKRLVANKEAEGASPSAGLRPSSSKAAGGGSPDFSSTLVTASNPAATALSTTYIYAAVVVFVLGLILGRWVL